MILIEPDGVALPALNLKWLRSQIDIQEPVLFATDDRGPLLLGAQRQAEAACEIVSGPRILLRDGAVAVIVQDVLDEASTSTAFFECESDFHDGKRHCLGTKNAPETTC